MTTWLLGSDGKPAVWVKGDEISLTIKLGGSGSISGATVTGSVQPKAPPASLLGPMTFTIVDAAERVVSYTFTEANTGLLSTDNDPTVVNEHIMDIKMVLGTVTTHSELLHFYVRAPRTA